MPKTSSKSSTIVSSALLSSLSPTLPLSASIINYPTFKPRHYQRELLDAFFIGKSKRFFYLCHRRAGKDMTCWNLMWGAALQRVGTYLYLLPQHNQSRKVIWKGIIGDGRTFLGMIPKQLIRKVNNTNMSIELVNGSIIQLGGGKNFDALMGTNPVGIVLSEFALHSPMVLAYLSPILVENGGFLICQTTPRGKNHAYQTFQAALQEPDWFVRRWTIADTKKFDGTPVITEAQIEAERRSGVSEEMIRQEWFLDWAVGNVGAYYTSELDDCEYSERLLDWQIDPRLPIYTFWDLGISDATAIWFMQPDGYDLKMVYYYEATGQGFYHYACKLDELKGRFGFKYKYHYAPHDVKQRHWGHNPRSTLQLAAECGISFLVVPRVSVEEGIQAAKAIFPSVWFHQTNCAQGIEALRDYHREFDEENRCFKDKPAHTWSSNCFAGDTKILTRNGIYRIMNLPKEGEILTKYGWKQYINPRITQKNAQLMEVVFKDGVIVRCTPEHLFLTEKGWKYAKNLMQHENIVATIVNRLSIESVRELNCIEDVWCITVPGIEHFSLANGAVVHNCGDSFRYFAVTWKEVYQRPEMSEQTTYQSNF
jgi:hypothetical protein